MSIEGLNSFLAAFSESEELRDLMQGQELEKIIEMANNAGYEVSEKDFETEDKELDLEELGLVAGGSITKIIKNITILPPMKTPGGSIKLAVEQNSLEMFSKYRNGPPKI